MPSFSLGRVLATPGALETLNEAGVSAASLLARHRAGDWGDLGDEDKAANDCAVIDGSRLLSAYKLPGGVRLWIITEAVGPDGSRASTTLLLPKEY